MQITYGFLREAMKKGLRNGNWRRRLSAIERAFYMASLCYARIRSIINANIVEKLLAIVEMLYETPASRIFKRGFEKALEILSAGVKNPLREWLKDPEYIFWLGACFR